VSATHVDDSQTIIEIQTPARYLLGPGPSLVDPRIYRAMMRPVIGHLDPALLKMLDQIQDLLRKVFETENPLTLAVSGTGSAGMEAAVANLVEPGDRMLVCINGYFGGRIAEMAGRNGAEVLTVERPWGEVFSGAEVSRSLESFGPKVVAVVQAETSTGACQPLEEIAEAAHKNGALLLVDAVTSLGGLQVGVDSLEIDACYSGSQKCLGCPPGLAPVTFGPRAEQALYQRRQPPANWYLDLDLLGKYWGADRAYHHTISATLIYALYEGLKIVQEEGLANRWGRHRRNAKILWEGLEDLGLEMHVVEEFRLPTLTTVRIPEGVDDMAVRRRLLEEYNIEIGGGLGSLKGKVWRIGLMGYSSRPEMVQLLLGSLKTILKG
jgi:alanine-glyoxylate transaminase / serine-glyoxylate transaminase / serine-pyruvate transaminase